MSWPPWWCWVLLVFAFYITAVRRLVNDRWPLGLALWFCAPLWPVVLALRMGKSEPDDQQQQ